ncbi:exodeoxyribonuclease VII small subunit [Schwartzia sp. (in: firmicutes)]|nr:exodeoxyribonuclease VII small subunit [Schwartzia sp. (in: firmicutes)]
MPKEKEPSFEKALEELESIVQDMENNEPDLADLMEKYSRGVILSQKCMKSLERAEKAMDLMVKKENDKVQELELKIERD